MPLFNFNGLLTTFAKTYLLTKMNNLLTVPITTHIGRKHFIAITISNLSETKSKATRYLSNDNGLISIYNWHILLKIIFY